MLKVKPLGKSSNSNDRRAFNISPTDKAVAIYPEILEIKDEWHCNMTSHMYKEDIAAEIAERISGRYIKEFELLLNELQK